MDNSAHVRVTLADGSLLDLDDTGAPARIFTTQEFTMLAVESAEAHLTEPLTPGEWALDPECSLGDGTMVATVSVCAPSHPRQQHRLHVPDMPQDELRKFVLGLADGRLFTSGHLREHETDLLPMIFLPLALGALSQCERFDAAKIGAFWEWNSKASPRSINGLPIFFSVRMINVRDWQRANAAVAAEQERRKTLDV